MENEKFDTFSKRLAFMLSDRNIGKSEIAEMLGIHRTTVHWWLKGKNIPKGVMMRKIEEIFDMFNPSWINDGRGQMNKDVSTSSGYQQVEYLLSRLKDKEQLIELLKDKIKLLEEKINK